MFELDLDTVLTTYREALGSGNLLLLDMIKRVVPTKDGTLATSADGTLYYCPEWCEKWVTSPVRLRDVLMHEAGHPVMGDFNRDYGWLSNFAADAVINAFLFNTGLSPCDLMRSFYDPQDQSGILRSASRLKNPDFHKLYKRLYPGHKPDPTVNLPSTPEVLEALSVLIPPDERKGTLFIGTHGNGCSTPTKDAGGSPIVIDKSLPGDVVSDIGEKMLKKIEEEQALGGCGHNPHFSKMCVGVRHSTRRMREDVLRQYACDSRKDKLKTYFEDVQYTQSVVPVSMSRSQAVQVACGYDPVFFRAPVQAQAETEKGLYVYVDVSGSVWGALPGIMSVLRRLNDIVRKIYTFSCGIHETTAEELGKGRFTSTGGTEFDSVIEHAVKIGAEKVLLFTDGAAAVTPENQKKAKRYIEKMGMIYFGSEFHDNWIEKHYKCVHRLKDVTTQ